MIAENCLKLEKTLFLRYNVLTLIWIVVKFSRHQICSKTYLWSKFQKNPTNNARGRACPKVENDLKSYLGA